MKLRHLPLLLLLSLPTVALAKGWVQDPNTGCAIWTVSSDAASWDGACVGGKANGKGTATYKKDGKLFGTYEGDMEDGDQNGQGVFVGADGDRYEGQFKDGKFDGQGVNTYSDGQRYEGAFKNGKKNGLGKQTAADGSLIHEGQWKNDQPVRVAAAPAPVPVVSGFGVGDSAYACLHGGRKSCRVIVTQAGGNNTQVEFKEYCSEGPLHTGFERGSRDWVPTDALVRSPSECRG